MKRTLLLITLLLTMSFVGLSQNPLADITCAPNEILYVTKYGYPLQEDTFETEGFGGYFIKNTYKNGVGKLTFDFDITQIPEGAFAKCQSLTHIKLPNSVTEIEEDAFYGCTSLISITIGNGVTSIGGGAFYGCTSLRKFYSKYASQDGRCIIVNGKLMAFAPAGLTKYTIPNSVTSIGEGVFYDCSSLTSITIPNGVTSLEEGAFYGCSSLTSIIIGNSITSIESRAFEGCSSLTSITIPESVTEIGKDAFKNCTGELIINSKIVEKDHNYNDYPMQYGWLVGSKFTSLTIGNGITYIGEFAFYDCTSLTSITIPDSVTSIGERAFSGCYSLTSITIPDSVTSIGDGAFYGCDSLTSVTIPDGVTSIGYEAFRNCSSLTSITIPDSVTSIGGGAFRRCSSLTSVTISDSVTSIGEYAFYECYSLTSITIPDSVTSIGYDAFQYCSSLTSVTIGDSVTSIGGGAFYGCEISDTYVNVRNLAKYCEGNNSSVLPGAKHIIIDGKEITELVIPDSVTSIDYCAFYDCTSLTSITIPDSVTSIGERAFSDCSSLTSVTIGDSVTSIGSSAFAYCSSLKEVYCKPTTPPSGGSYMFDNNASGRKIYVPTWSVDAYKRAEYWRNYANSIVGYAFADITEEEPLAEEVEQKEEQKEEAKEEDVFVKVERMPSFAGGDLNTFRTWFGGEFKYPAIAAENGLQGRMVVKFVVEKDGRLTNIEFLQSPDPVFNEEVIRVLKKSPKWTPGYLQGKPCRVSYVLPIDLCLQ